jgi:hypothetical protein
MTNKEAILKHLVWMASDQPDRPGDKAYAWSSAKHIATLLDDWEDIPTLLTAEMLRLKREK